MHCTICKSEQVSLLYSSKDLANTQEPFDVYSCASCENAFTANAPEAAVIGRYYNHDDYISHTETNKGFINNLYLKARNYNLSNKIKLIRSYTSGNQLLDYGCGAGAFASYSADRDFSTLGLDTSPDALTAAQEKGVKAFHVEHLPKLDSDTFEVITLWHVLEHVHELHSTLENLYRVAKSGAYIFIAVPNVTSHDAKFYGADWAALDLPRHLYHFTPSGLPALVEQFGFTAVAQHPMPLDSYYVSLLSEKYKGSLPKPFQMARAGLVATLSNIKKQSKNQSSIIYVFNKR